MRGDDLAYPFASHAGQPFLGLEKRELFAAMAMQGMATQAHPLYETGHCNSAIAERSVLLADALITELSKAQP